MLEIAKQPLDHFMQRFARRTVLAAACLLGAGPGIASPVVARHRKLRVTQSGLAEAIDLHFRWLTNETEGARAVLANCDLSGLDFLSDQPGTVDLRGADFTGADLSGIRGNELSFHHASLQGARMTSSFLSAPVFSGATLRRALCNHVVWGWPAARQTGDVSADDFSPTATFINTDLDLADFKQARVRGNFCGAQFTHASLVDADLSCSRFDGDAIYCPNSFAGSRLIRTKFGNTTVNATRFRFAFDRADFSGATIGPDCTWPGTPAGTIGLQKPRDDV
ncbi:hypothetical protein XH99_28925 [Bradyrhizobium nanningense]|uniref:Pentapeptide repeat-containing protein n=1 Tax=Bradyrhizobium nanningense TaxID=1325118 RepID=A0A4Q0RXE8_9BRAD|nr:pentapeptide repeat-containing protein [Bradyrhizobium nanningense]RXH24114.1 hypothetical protein XH99_28925 [Bradyrhizobium nanningense]RXH29331.1 hypothetical protein XH84_22875 [Bradyrhizobium nanningense]